LRPLVREDRYGAMILGRGEKAAVAKPVGTGLHWRSSDVLTLPKFVARAATNGHEIKLAGETGELARSVTPLRRDVTEADMVRR